MHGVGDHVDQHAEQHQSQLLDHERPVTGEVEGAGESVAIALFGCWRIDKYGYDGDNDVVDNDIDVDVDRDLECAAAATARGHWWIRWNDEHRDDRDDNNDGKHVEFRYIALLQHGKQHEHQYDDRPDSDDVSLSHDGTRWSCEIGRASCRERV